MELGKVRLGSLVVLTALVGYAVAARGSFSPWRALWLCTGTMLSAAGANGLNQWLEAGRDARMLRTRSRPLPSLRIGGRHALCASLFSATAGVLLLLAGTNAFTAALSLLTVLLYVLVYTPLKTVSSINTLVGAIVGAIPPLMGWTAARGALAPAAFVLGALLFVWQVPHFLALAWLYRDDYRRGEYRMLPLSDPSGSVTCWMALLYSLALIPVGLAAVIAGLSGMAYAAGALLLGGLMVERSARLLSRRTDRAARQVFWASLAYLPLLLGLMVADGGPTPPAGAQAGITAIHGAQAVD